MMNYPLLLRIALAFVMLFPLSRQAFGQPLIEYGQVTDTVDYGRDSVVVAVVEFIAPTCWPNNENINLNGGDLQYFYYRWAGSGYAYIYCDAKAPGLLMIRGSLSIETSSCSSEDTSFSFNVFVKGEPDKVQINWSQESPLSIPQIFGNEMQLSVELATICQIQFRICDQLGRTVKQVEQVCHNGMNRIELETSSLPPGSYYYVLRGAEWNRTGKLVKVAP